MFPLFPQRRVNGWYHAMRTERINERRSCFFLNFFHLLKWYNNFISLSVTECDRKRVYIPVMSNWIYFCIKVFCGNDACQRFRDFLQLHHQCRCGDWPYIADIYTRFTHQCLFISATYGHSLQQSWWQRWKKYQKPCIFSSTLARRKILAYLFSAKA
jgi:hypothetical protein